jgi:hypothetical protein
MSWAWACFREVVPLTRSRPRDDPRRRAYARVGSTPRPSGRNFSLSGRPGPGRAPRIGVRPVPVFTLAFTSSFRTPAAATTDRTAPGGPGAHTLPRRGGRSRWPPARPGRGVGRAAREAGFLLPAAHRATGPAEPGKEFSWRARSSAVRPPPEIAPTCGNNDRRGTAGSPDSFIRRLPAHTFHRTATYGASNSPGNTTRNHRSSSRSSNLPSPHPSRPVNRNHHSGAIWTIDQAYRHIQPGDRTKVTYRQL